MYSNAKLNWETGKFDTSYLCNNYYYFELIEDEIDVDNIEELEEFELDQFINMDNAERFDRTMIEYSKINSIIRWTKQADKEIKELKSLNIEISEKDINEALKKAREQLNKEKSIKEK